MRAPASLSERVASRRAALHEAVTRVGGVLVSVVCILRDTRGPERIKLVVGLAPNTGLFALMRMEDQVARLLEVEVEVEVEA